MQRPLSRLRPNHTDVAAKVVDDEVVLINLVTGVYYGCRDRCDPRQHVRSIR